MPVVADDLNLVLPMDADGPALLADTLIFLVLEEEFEPLGVLRMLMVEDF